MRAPWSLDNVTIPAQGLSHEVGIPGAKLFVTVANNIVVGGTPTTVEVLPNGSTQNLKIGYGTVMTFPINAEWVLITGTGANVSVRLSSIPMPLTVNVVSVSSIGATVNTDVGQGGQKSGNTTLNFGGTPVDPRDRNWTLGSGDTPSRSWALGSGDTPGRSWALGSSDVPGRGWTLGSTDTPGRSWSLGSGDTPGRSWNMGPNDQPVIQGETPTAGTYKPVQTDANGNLLRGWTLGSGDTPGRSWTLGASDVPGRGWTLGSSDNPVPWSSANKPFNADASGNLEHVPVLPGTTTPVWNSQVKQDTVGNIQHVPVLQGTSTPIHTKALQYDSNNYPLHTIGNVLAGGNGGDSVINSISGTPFDTTGYYNIVQAPPSGYKWVVWGIWTGFFIESAISSPSVSFTQWDFGVESLVNVANAGGTGAVVNPYWQLLRIIAGDTVTQAGAANVASMLYCGNGPNGWLSGNVSANINSYDLLSLHGASFQGATLNVPFIVTPNMRLLFEVTVSAISDIDNAYLTMLPMGYQEPL